MIVGVYAKVVTLLLAISGVNSQAIMTTATTFAYTNTTISIDCPIEVAVTTVNWRGPPDNIIYYDPGTGVFNSNLGEKINRLSFPANNSMLLSGTKLSDAGLYSCSITVNSQVYQGDNTVQVRTKANVPEITPLPDEINVLGTEGKSLTITCISRGGNPAPTLVLYKGSINGQVLSGTSTVSTVGDTFTVTLSYKFTPTRADDRQQLVCRSYWPSTPNDMDSQQTSVTLNLYLKPLQPTVPQPVSVGTGNTVTVTCTTTGSRPAADISWLYRGQTFTPPVSPTEDQSSLTFTVVSVLQRTVTAADNGQFVQCSVSNRAQTSPLTAFRTLDVHFPVERSSTRVTGNNQIEANGFNQLSLTCTTGSSNPVSDITWRNGSNVINNTSGYAVTSGANNGHVRSQVLTLQPTRHDDGDTITCSVSNGLLQMTDTIAVVLNLNFPVDRSSTIITGNTQIEANGVNPLTLTCTTGSSNPASDITWRKGSDIISNTNAYTVTSGANNGHVRSQVLTLQPTRHDDGDTITCAVSNGVLQMTDITNVVLNLKYSPVIADMSDMDVIEGEQATLKCNATSKPVASYTWKKDATTVSQGTGTTNYNGYDYTIPTVIRTQDGTYTCTAYNQLSQTDSKQTILTVLYPPDIDVIAANTTVNSPSTTVICYPSGVPDQYTYQRWVHTWNGQTVTHPVPLPNTTVLTLTDLSYAHSGVYTCGASNGVKGIVSHSSGSLLVKSFPIIVGVAAETKEVKIAGQLLQPITAHFQYFSNAGKGSVKVYWTNGTTDEVGTVTYRDVAVQLPVFGSTITTPGTEAIINITVKEESRFGRYEVRVTNEVNHVPLVTLALVIQPVGTPEPPFDLSVASIRQSVEVTWTSGSPNGLNQTFIIQLSTDNNTWLDISQYGGLSFQQTHQQRVDDLRAGQIYYIRMVSENNAGKSTPTRIITFTTEALDTTDSGSSSGWILGGVASGLLLILVVVFVILFIIWRRKGLSLLGNRYNTGTVNERDKWSHTEGTHERESTDDAAIATGEVSDTALQYDTLHDTSDRRLYEQLKANEAHENPLTNDSIGLSTYESLQRGQDNEQRTYEQLQSQGTLPTVYENLKVKTTM